ncbi:MAG: hypothetical protein LBE56_14305 [Tannerella sp.]|jgi:hypothetical protein|nr:hypothetical protein [Tannerella sp.]
MKKESVTQKRIFQELEKLFRESRLAAEVSGTLKIELDAAYRRIRGETALGLDEAVILCSRYGMSLDYIVGNEYNNLVFSYNPIEFENLDSYRLYIRQFTETVLSLARRKNGEIFYTAEDVPLFHILRHRELMFFNIFVWFNAVLGATLKFERFVEEIDNKESLYQDFNLLSDSYFNIASCEIWTEDTVRHLLRSLEYYCNMGVFQERNTVSLLFSQLNGMLATVRNWTETGKKDGKKDFKLYISATNLANNYILLKNESQTVVGIRLYTVKSIVTRHPAFCMETEKWIENLMKKSTLLSGSSEMEREQFFQRTQREIDRRKEKCLEKFNGEDDSL